MAEEKQWCVQDIVADWLKANGYDGLAGDECGCKVDDIAPCGLEGCLHCVAGHAVIVGGPECNTCELAGGCEPVAEGVDFCMRPGKGGGK